MRWLRGTSVARARSRYSRAAAFASMSKSGLYRCSARRLLRLEREGLVRAVAERLVPRVTAAAEVDRVLRELEVGSSRVDELHRPFHLVRAILERSNAHFGHGLPPWHR